MKKFLFWVCLGCLVGCQTLPTSAEWKIRGDGFVQDSKFEQAIQAYSKAITLNSKQADLYAARGAAYFSIGSYELAKQDFIEALRYNPYQLEAYHALATTLSIQGDYQEALALVNQVLIPTSQNPEIFFTRGGIYFMLQKYEQAVQDYSFVLQKRPAADVYKARAAAYLELKEPQKAQADLDAAQSGKYPDKLSDYQLIRGAN